jgi:lipopolysaccharide biosynthesis glycosyltransferase
MSKKYKRINISIDPALYSRLKMISEKQFHKSIKPGTFIKMIVSEYIKNKTKVFYNDADGVIAEQKDIFL